MPIDDRARLIALELLVSHIVADLLRQREDKAEAAGQVLAQLLDEIRSMRLDDAVNLDEEARLRTAIGDSAHRLVDVAFKMAL